MFTGRRRAVEGDPGVRTDAVRETLALLGPADTVADVQRLREEILRLKRVEAAALEFCERCRRGEVRSHRSYLRFVEALGPDRAEPEDEPDEATSVDERRSIASTSTSQPSFGRAS